MSRNVDVGSDGIPIVRSHRDKGEKDYEAMVSNAIYGQKQDEIHRRLLQQEPKKKKDDLEDTSPSSSEDEMIDFNVNVDPKKAAKQAAIVASAQRVLNDQYTSSDSSDEVEVVVPKKVTGKPKAKASVATAAAGDDDDDDEDEENKIPQGRPECQVLLSQKPEDNMQALVVMCMGLKSRDGTRSLADIENDELYKMCFPKNKLPKVQDMKNEMKRRAAQRGITKLRKNSAPRAECLRWLFSNPIVNEVDIDFLVKEEEKVFNMLLAVKAQSEAAAREKLQGSSWTNGKPFARLCHCMLDDSVRALLANELRCMTREELDARNSDDRPDTFWQAVVKLYNDPTYDVSTISHPDIPEFEDTMDLKFEDMPGGAITADEAKKKAGDTRAKVTQIIAAWELSGNGSGQRGIDHPEFGHPDETLLEEGDDRTNFVRPHLGHRFHHVYFWKVMDMHGCLNNFLSVLNHEVGGDSDNVHTDAANVQHKRKRASPDELERRERKRFRLSVGASLKMVAIATTAEILQKEEDKVLKMSLGVRRAQDEDEREMYKELLAHHQKKVGDLEKELDDMRKQNIDGDDDFEG